MVRNNSQLKFKDEEEKNTIEEKIGECLGLEKAAQKAVDKLNEKGLLDDYNIKKKLTAMQKEAKGHEDKLEKLLGWLRESGLDQQKIEQKGQETEKKL